MAVYRVQGPDGRVYRIEGPDGASAAQVEAFAAQQFGGVPSVGAAKERAATRDSSFAGDLLAGAVRGAGSIGATILAPIDAAARSLGVENDFIGRRDRREAMTGALHELGADTDSWAFKGGQLAGEIAGTAGLPIALARPVAAAAPRFAQALATGGFRTGPAPAATLGQRAANMGARMAGGATAGGASAALVNPGDAATGAAVGAALPPALRGVALAGKGGGVVGSAVTESLRSDASRAGRELAQALGVTQEQLPAVVAQLRQSRALVPGAAPTVAQALDSPQSAILQRVVADSPGGEVLRQALAGQQQARVAAMQGVQPGAAGRTSIEAAENLGRTAAAEGAEAKGWIKVARDAQYGNQALASAQIVLPGKAAARQAVEGFYGGGVGFDTAPADLRGIISRLDSGAPVPFKEFDTLRKLAGNRQRDLVDSDRTASAAWGAVKRLLDGAEQAAITAGERLRPTGQGPWGPVYERLAGDTENAVAHILNTKTGSVPGAAVHPLLGKIELAAGQPGKKATGLLHIESQGRDDILRQLPELLRDGSAYSRLEEAGGVLRRKAGHPQVHIGDGSQEAAIRLDFDRQARQWMPTAYDQWPSRRIPIETGRLANEAGLTQGTNSSPQLSGTESLLDIEAAFRAFDQSLQPAPALRDPRLYSGDLASAVSPDAAQALQQGRALHRDMEQRFGTGPWSYAWRTGSDGLPVAQGAELGRRFVNSGMSQLADLKALKAGVLERGPTMQAARQYALADLLEKSVTQDGKALSAARLNQGIKSRSLALKELLTPEQWQQLKAVEQDALRASEAAWRAISGSKTYQSTANALNEGLLLESPAVQAMLGRTPLIGKLLQSGASGLVAGAKSKKANRLAELLADAQAAATSLEGMGPINAGPRAPAGLVQLQQLGGPALYRAAPLLSIDR